MSGRLYGCIEAGGTKFVCAVAGGPDDVRAVGRIETTSPAETLTRAIDFLRANGLDRATVAAIGIGSFGPCVVDPASPDWGRIAQTPKPGWAGTDIAGAFGAAFGAPIGFDTDVNAAALAEARWGAARGDDVALYLTVGTGIGGGVAIDGRPVHGLRHPEVGHVPLPRHPDDGDFEGFCPFHGAGCAEGLVSGPAIKMRWGASLSELPADHPAHDIVAWYLGRLAVAAVAMLSPRRIVMGGGVMATPGLIERVRCAARQAAGGYFTAAGKSEDFGGIIVSPGLGDRSGLLGALALAMAAERRD